MSVCTLWVVGEVLDSQSDKIVAGNVDFITSGQVFPCYRTNRKYFAKNKETLSKQTNAAAYHDSQEH